MSEATRPEDVERMLAALAEEMRSLEVMNTAPRDVRAKLLMWADKMLAAVALPVEPERCLHCQCFPPDTRSCRCPHVKCPCRVGAPRCSTCQHYEPGLPECDCRTIGCFCSWMPES